MNPDLATMLEQLLEAAAERGASKVLAVNRGAKPSLATEDRPGSETSSALQPLAVTVAEAALLLKGVPETTIRDWIKAGALRAARTPGGRTYLVEVAELRAFLARHSLDGAVAVGSSVEERVVRILDKDRRRAEKAQR